MLVGVSVYFLRGQILQKPFHADPSKLHEVFPVRPGHPCVQHVQIPGVHRDEAYPWRGMSVQVFLPSQKISHTERCQSKQGWLAPL